MTVRPQPCFQHVAQSTSLLTAMRTGYPSLTTYALRIQLRTVFLDNLMRHHTLPNDIQPPHKCIRLILANIPMLISPRFPACCFSGQDDHVD